MQGRILSETNVPTTVLCSFDVAFRDITTTHDHSGTAPEQHELVPRLSGAISNMAIQRSKALGQEVGEVPLRSPLLPNDMS